MKKILLDNKEFQFKKEDLPLLIHGAEHVGASLFTVTLLADLYRQGENIVFLSGYHMAMDEFLTQIDSHEEGILVERDGDMLEMRNKKALFVRREDAELFIKIAREISDRDERVFLIKNIDLFPEDVFRVVLDKQKVVVSGDVNTCVYKDTILEKRFKGRILFSSLEGENTYILPSLEKYHGYYWGEKDKGNVSLRIE